MENQENELVLADFLTQADVSVVDVLLKTLKQLESEGIGSSLSIDHFKKHARVLLGCMRGLNDEVVKEHAPSLVSLSLKAFSNVVAINRGTERSILPIVSDICSGSLRPFGQLSELKHAEASGLCQCLKAFEHALDLCNDQLRSSGGDVAVDWSGSAVEPFLTVFHQSLCQSSFPAASIERVGDARVVECVQNLFSGLVSLLEMVPQRICHFLCSSILPHFLTEASCLKRLDLLWKLICRIVRDESGSAFCGNRNLAFVILCCLSASFVGSGISLSASITAPLKLSPSVFNVCEKKVLWDIIQEGLMARDPLDRKRSMFLLQHCTSAHAVSTEASSSSVRGAVASPGGVYWWDPTHSAQLQSVWGDFMLMMDTLEEKQVHIVKPVKPRLANLIAAANSKINGHRVLHFSWLSIVWQRIFVHDAKNIVKWGVRSCLGMDLEPGSPLLEKENWNFIFGALFGILSQSTVLSRDPDLPFGSCPTIVKLLRKFIGRIFELSNLEDTKQFLMVFLRQCKTQVVADIPLCYFSQVLSTLPPQPLLNSEGLLLIRVILNSSLLTHQIVMRSAVQCFFLTAAVNQVDLPAVHYSDVGLLCGALKSSECLAFGSTSWQSAAGLLCSVAAAQHLSGGKSLCDYLRAGVRALLSTETHRDSVEVDTPLSATNLARLVMLAISHVGSEQDPLRDTDPVGTLIRPVLEVFAQAASRPYLSRAVVHQCVEFLTSLLGDLRSGAAVLGGPAAAGAQETAVVRALEEGLPELVDGLVVLLLSASEDSNWPDLHQVNQLLTLWRHVDWALSLSPSYTSHFSLLLTRIVGRADDMLSKVDFSKPIVLSCDVVGVVSLLGWACQKLWELSEAESPKRLDLFPDDVRRQMFSLVRKMDLNPQFTKPQTTQVGSQDSSYSTTTAAQPSPQQWGQVVSSVLASLWTCYRVLLARRPLCRGDALAAGDVLAVFSNLTDCIDTAQVDMPVVLDCLAAIVPEMIDHGLNQLLEFIGKCWSLVLSLRNHHRELWLAVKSFVRFAFHPSLLMPSEELRCEVVPVLMELNDGIHTLGESKSGHYNLLVAHCCQEWLRAGASGQEAARARLHSSLADCTPLVLEACMFGPVGKRSEKSVDDVDAYISSLKDSCGSNQLRLMYRQSDSSVRVTVVSFLFELMTFDKTTDNWVTTEYLEHLLTSMVQKTLSLSELKPRYYINSLPHRRKTRLWQVVLTLVHFANSDMSAQLIPLLFECLNFDNQLSVKHMLEWVCTFLLVKCPSLLPRVLEALSFKEQSTRLSCLPSFISIGCQLFAALKEDQTKVTFCRQFIQVLLCWTQGHHVVSRLYAQAALLRVWEDMKGCESLSPLLAEFALLESMVEFTKEHSDVVKFQHKLKSNVYFSLIDLYKDWNLETIHRCLPLVTGVIATELIGVDEFRCASSFWDQQDVLPLICSRPKLLERCQEFESSMNDANRECEGDGEGDVQKKIVPWSGPEALHELFPDHVILEGGRTDLEQSIVMVTSLVSKPANLGGLSRTCEIFGVTELVICNKNILDDPLFQALSVTSEHWLNITEVRIPELSGYLLSAKRQGYTLVGVEQTANSKCLTRYRFPKKTVLLLGNEREGIPVDLIHHLDECVEIPQLGLVRSLNVHVSGALMVWEYAKQHLVHS